MATDKRSESHNVQLGPGRYSSSDSVETDHGSASSETVIASTDLRSMIPVIVADEVRRQEDAKAAQLRREENERANHRNTNRLLMLLVAMVWSFFVPTIMVALFGPGSLKFSLFVTIVPDAVLSLYALIRKY